MTDPVDAEADAVELARTTESCVEFGAAMQSASVWLNGVHPKLTEGADVQAGTTVDQIAARHLCKDTQLTSLELALEPNYMVGNCNDGYSCVYMNTFVWRTPTMPLPMENNRRRHR